MSHLHRRKYHIHGIFDITWLKQKDAVSFGQYCGSSDGRMVRLAHLKNIIEQWRICLWPLACGCRNLLGSTGASRGKVEATVDPRKLAQSCDQ
jgi:hypothetical protein